MIRKSWDSDQSDTVAHLRQNYATLKIILKTKNDSFFLDAWIRHHVNIVGKENIIIFDNCSTDPDVFDVYDRWPEVNVVGFHGHQDNIHWMHNFPALYNALRLSCSYYIFIDTDEFIVFFDGARFVSDKGIISALQHSLSGDFIPTVWLYNVPLYREQFIIGTTCDDLYRGLQWGKPIIRASLADQASSINHNCQLAQCNAKAIPLKGFFLLHMAYLSPAQRIRANQEKLVASGFIQKYRLSTRC